MVAYLLQLVQKLQKNATLFARPIHLLEKKSYEKTSSGSQVATYAGNVSQNIRGL